MIEKKTRAEQTLEGQLLKMKAMGVTISYKPGLHESDSLGRHAMETLHAKAKELGMTYGDEPKEQTDDNPS